MLNMRYIISTSRTKECHLYLTLSITHYHEAHHPNRWLVYTSHSTTRHKKGRHTSLYICKQDNYSEVINNRKCRALNASHEENSSRNGPRHQPQTTIYVPCTIQFLSQHNIHALVTLLKKCRYMCIRNNKSQPLSVSLHDETIHEVTTANKT